MQYMKLSTSRDFRINVSTLESALQDQDAEDAENEPDNDQVRSGLMDTCVHCISPVGFLRCSFACQLNLGELITISGGWHLVLRKTMLVCGTTAHMRGHARRGRTLLLIFSSVSPSIYFLARGHKKMCHS